MQVEAEAELWGWQGSRGWARIPSHAETTDHSQKLPSALVCRWRRSGHVTRYSAWLIPHIFFKITNHNQHPLNIKHLANFIKKYWTCFRYQKLADFLVCFPPSVCVQVRWPPSWKICLMIQLSLGFWGRAVKAFNNFSRKLAWLLKKCFKSFGRGICLPDSPNWRYRQNYDVNKCQVWIREAFLGRISASPEATDGWHCWQNIPNL